MTPERHHTPADIEDAHKEKMRNKVARRVRWNAEINSDRTLGAIPVNRHTGKPHEHKREIARNMRRASA